MIDTELKYMLNTNNHKLIFKEGKTMIGGGRRATQKEMFRDVIAIALLMVAMLVIASILGLM